MNTLELETAITVAKAAGEAVRDLYDRADTKSYTKSDGSPVTDAGITADRIIRAMLLEMFPDDAILTEEGADDSNRLHAVRVWLVDPIDGTHQFVERTGEFDVLIALIVKGSPVAGVLLQPTTGTFLAAALGAGAMAGGDRARKPFRFAPVGGDSPPRLLASSWLNGPASLPGLTAVASRLGSNPAVISPLGVVVRHFLPPHHNYDVLVGLPTMAGQTMAWEWDFAAAGIVVHEAGGRFTNALGQAIYLRQTASSQRGRSHPIGRSGDARAGARGGQTRTPGLTKLGGRRFVGNHGHAVAGPLQE